MKNKKGVVNKALIGMIIFLITVVAILIVFYNLNLGKITEQEACHLSVVARSSAIATTNLAKNTIPLNCKTQYVCLTEDGTCEKLTSPEIEKVKSKKEVYKVLANQLAECWWMFGEGKVDYIGEELSSGKLYCSLCAQVVFDESLTSLEGLESGEIDKEDFYRYLTITDKDEIEKISYWDYLYEESGLDEITNAVPAGIDNTEKVVSFCDSFCKSEDAFNFCSSSTILTKSDGSVFIGSCYALSKTTDSGINNCIKLSCPKNRLNEEVTISTPQKISKFGTINFDKRYYVTMGIISDLDAVSAAFVAGGTAAAFAIVSAGVITITGGVAIPLVFVGIAAVGGGAFLGGTTYLAATIIEGESGQQYLRPTIIEASEDFESLKCKDVKTIS
jgi:hypothetical protein